MAIFDFDGWMETLEVISDPRSLKGLKQGLKDIKKGRVFNEEDVCKLLKKKNNRTCRHEA